MSKSLNISEWMADPNRAVELAKLLSSPIVQEALKMLSEMTMAKTLHKSNILEIANSSSILFGYDMGRVSILEDLKVLSVYVEPQKPLTPTYTQQ